MKKTMCIFKFTAKGTSTPCRTLRNVLEFNLAVDQLT